MKHAYLIIAHKNLCQLKVLINLLDDPRNDIFVFIDKKAQVDSRQLLNNTKYSKLIFADRFKVYWGTNSSIQAELALFELAHKTYKYAYYHLISGQCLPLHSQDYIHAFFQQNSGKEFFTFVSQDIIIKNNLSDRFQYYYFFTRRFHFLNRITIKAQKILGINRCKNEAIDIGYGSNWISCTNEFVEYMLSNKSSIKKRFKYSWCCDEVYKHLLILNSDFKERLFVSEGVNDKKADRQGNARYINWWDGNPKTWTSADKEELEEASKRGYLFTRKFDEVLDKEIISFVVNMVQQEIFDSTNMKPTVVL